MQLEEQKQLEDKGWVGRLQWEEDILLVWLALQTVF